MRRGRILIFVLLILLIVGLIVAALAIRQFLPQLNRPAEPLTIDVYRTSQNIPQGASVEENMITLIAVPQDAALDAYFTAVERADLVGKVAKYPLEQGHIISSADVQDASQAVVIGGPQWAALIPPGMTTSTIPTNRLSLAGYGITDGAHVNVVACLLFVDVDPSFQSILPNNTALLTGTGFVPDSLPILSMSVSPGGPQGRVELDPSLQQPFFLIPSEAQRPRLVCQTLLQDVVVMKLGDFPLEASAATAETQAQAFVPDIVTLIVSPQDSDTLAYLMLTNSKIVMTLRNPSDQSRQATEGVTLQFLLSQYNIPVPAKLPYSMQPAIVDLSTLPQSGAPTPAPAE